MEDPSNVMLNTRIVHLYLTSQRSKFRRSLASRQQVRSCSMKHLVSYGTRKEQP